MIQAKLSQNLLLKLDKDYKCILLSSLSDLLEPYQKSNSNYNFDWNLGPQDKCFPTTNRVREVVSVLWIEYLSTST